MAGAGWLEVGGSPWSWKYSKTTACTGVTATDRVRSASSTSMVTRPRVCFQLRVRMAWGGPELAWAARWSPVEPRGKGSLTCPYRAVSSSSRRGQGSGSHSHLLPGLSNTEHGRGSEHGGQIGLRETCPHPDPFPRV